MNQTCDGCGTAFVLNPVRCKTCGLACLPEQPWAFYCLDCALMCHISHREAS